MDYPILYICFPWRTAFQNTLPATPDGFSLPTIFRLPGRVLRWFTGCRTSRHSNRRPPFWWSREPCTPCFLWESMDGFAGTAPTTYWCALRREFSGMIHWLAINNHPSNPQQPIQQPCVKRTSKKMARYASKSGWWYTYPSEKYEFVSWDYYSRYREKNVPNH